MLVSLYILLSMSAIILKFLKILQNGGVHSDIIILNQNPRIYFILAGLKSSVVPDILNTVSSAGIPVYDMSEQISGVSKYKLWELEVPRQDLIVELRGIRVLKGQIPANHCEQDDELQISAFSPSYFLPGIISGEA